MLLHIPDTLQISSHVLTGRVAGLSRKKIMGIYSNPTGSGVNHVVIDLTFFLCACYNANILPSYPYVTCRLNIVSTLADTIFGRVTNMLVTCRADTHVSVDSTIFSTFENPTFPAKAPKRVWSKPSPSWSAATSLMPSSRRPTAVTTTALTTSPYLK